MITNMAIISRGMVLLCLGTLVFSSLFTKVTKGSKESSIHVVRRGCEKDSDSVKGNHCLNKEEEEEDDDDTYKIVNNNRVSISPSGDQIHPEDSSEDGSSSSEANHSNDDGPEKMDIDHDDHVIVMGH